MNNQNLKSCRDGFGEALVLAGEKNKDIVVLTANLGESTRAHLFGNRFQDRFFDIGVAEQSLVTVASGMANYGKIPFITSYAVFSPGRAFEQVKVTIAMNNLPVKIVGAHSGLGAGPYGATHQSLEDIALMRILPNMIVIQPCDYEEAKKATLAVAINKKPSYLRLSRQDSEIITKKEDAFEIGKINILRYGNSPRVAIIGCGPILAEGLKAAENLFEKDIEVMVINSHTIKPLDEDGILKVAKQCGAIVTIEEHQIAGGLGSAIAEFLVSSLPAGRQVPIEFIGIRDSFGESGTTEELFEKFGLTASSIEKAVMKVLTRKSQ